MFPSKQKKHILITIAYSIITNGSRRSYDQVKKVVR